MVSASREIAAFFPDFSEQRWYEEEEPQFRCGPVRYSPEGGIHLAATTEPPKDSVMQTSQSMKSGDGTSLFLWKDLRSLI